MSVYTPTSTNSRKRELSSPEFEADLKKNKTYADIVMSPPPGKEDDQPSFIKSQESNTKHSSQVEMAENSANIISNMDAGTIPPVQSITIPQEEMDKLSKLLLSNFENQIDNIVHKIVSSITSKLNEKIDTLELSNKQLQSENAELKNHIRSMEMTLDDHEQYSRRNNIRISGVPETDGESTDNIVVNLCEDIEAGISLNEIDRSHRVGKPKSNSSKPRDILVKMASYRFRRRIFLRRSELGKKGHAGVFVNEDLTRQRSLLLFKSRELVRSRHLLGAWSSDGNILVKDNKSKVHRIQFEHQLDTFLLYQPRPEEEPISADLET